MGGYTNYSEEENRAYAAATGTQYLGGSGSGWLEKEAEIRSGLSEEDRSLDKKYLDLLVKEKTREALGYHIAYPAPPITKKDDIVIQKPQGSYDAKTYVPVGAEVMFGSWKDPKTNEVVGREPFPIEGTYEKVGTYEFGTEGNSRPGTLWKSSTGFYQVVDPKGQTFMSGSAGAPVPEYTALNKETSDYLAAGTWGKWTPKKTEVIPDIPKSASEPIPYKTTTGQIRGGADYTGNEWLPQTTQQKSNITPFHTGGTIHLPSTNMTEIFGKPKQTGLGYFGAKRNGSKPKKTYQQKPCEKSMGFMDVFSELKKPKAQPKKAAVNKPVKNSSPLWSGITFGSTPKVSPKIDITGKSIVKAPAVNLATAKKPVKKEKYGSAWEQVLFSKKKTKKQ